MLTKWISFGCLLIVSVGLTYGADSAPTGTTRAVYDSYSVDSSALGDLPKTLTKAIRERIASNVQTTIYVNYVEGQSVIDGTAEPILINERIKQVLFSAIRIDHPLVRYAIKDVNADLIIEATVNIFGMIDQRAGNVSINQTRSYFRVIDRVNGIILGQDAYLTETVMLWQAHKVLESKETKSGWE
jgi:hypothetical protein